MSNFPYLRSGSHRHAFGLDDKESSSAFLMIPVKVSAGDISWYRKFF